MLEHTGDAPCSQPSPGERQRVGSAGLGEEVRGWDVCASAWGSVHGFWQEVIEVT